MRRRGVIILLGGAGVWPLAANAQRPALSVIGYLSSRSPGDSTDIITAFRQGLTDAGFVEGQSVAIEYRFAEGHYDRLPTLAADLVRRHVNVVVATGGTISAVAAKPVVPSTIPIVFAMGGDPVKLRVVASLARPGGNITGVSFWVTSTPSVWNDRRHVFIRSWRPAGGGAIMAANAYEIVGEITQIQTIAVGRRIRDLPRLRRL